jgi:hypothetical protein
MFCDFCDCEDCKFGQKMLSHAETNKGTWICDICYYYDQCTNGPDRNPDGPCKDKLCKHRPILMGHWLKFSK